MLLLSLIAGIGRGILLHRRNLRLARGSETATEMAERSVRNFRAYVDGKPVESYIE